MSEIEKQKEVERKLLGLWHNLRSDYLWDFMPTNDDGEKQVIIMDEKKPTPITWAPHYNVILAEDEKISLQLWFKDYVTLHQVSFLADNILQIQSPPVDNAQKDSIILNKV